VTSTSFRKSRTPIEEDRDLSVRTEGFDSKHLGGAARRVDIFD
jgi:hypothetical protein